MEEWTSALDKQEVATDLVLRNEEEIPILNNYLLDVLAITKGERRGSVAEEEALDARDEDPKVQGGGAKGGGGVSLLHDSSFDFINL